MEFTKSQIAGLVLGYLKSEKCFRAMEEFVKVSPYLKEYRKGKYFVTRVSEMCLVDFLEEYANIYCIVHGRLEATNFYDEMRKGTTLVKKLLYLLEKNENTIINSTPVSATRENDVTPAYPQLENICSDESDASSHITPKRKVSKNRNSGNKKHETDEVFDVSEVFTQTFLENRELQEKIAENINIVRNTPEVAKIVPDDHISAGASKELDAIIKTVVQRTEEDPVYNKLIDEIIGTASFDNPPMKKSTPTLNTLHQSSSCSDVDDVSKHKRNISDKTENQSTSSDTIDDHNNDAVRSIIEVSQNPQQTQTNLVTPGLLTTTTPTASVSFTSTSTFTFSMTTTSTTSTICTPLTTTTTTENNEINRNDNGVFVFDGTLDTYLKSSGGQNSIPSNPVYINTGGLIVMPETTPKQFYIVNNQPLLNMNMSTVKGMITDTDIMAMPTIIVNDETHTTLTNHNFAVAPKSAPKNLPKRSKNQKIAPKTVIKEISPETTIKDKKKIKTPKVELINSIPKISPESSTVVVTASHTTPSVTTAPSTKAPTPRQASHVRNLDFSTPSTVKTPSKKSTWDADLRSLICPPTQKSPTPKRKRLTTGRSKTKKTKVKNKFEEVLAEKEEIKTEEKTVMEEEKIEMENSATAKEMNEKEKNVVEEEKEKDEGEKEKDAGEKEKKAGEKEKMACTTPVKDMIPKTPGAGGLPTTNSIFCTPFTDVLEEQLRGVDLISLPTPKIPITPSFALTPGLNLTPADLPSYNRSTDYSTSSSYYQPSDTEQNKSVEQLIEECRQLENKSPPSTPPLPCDKQLKIISDVVIKESCVSPFQTEETKKCDEHLKKFNHSMIGKKNLSLMQRPSSSSLSSDSDSSDSESEKSGEQSNKTVICRESMEEDDKKTKAIINDIINTVEVKKTLEDKSKKKDLLTHLEEVRKRTIDKIKNPPEVTNKTRNNKQLPKPLPKIQKVTETKRRRSTRRKETSPEDTDEEAQKLVTGLAQRGIHLIHKKTPQKSDGKKEKLPPPKEKKKTLPTREKKKTPSPKVEKKTLPSKVEKKIPPPKVEKKISRPKEEKKTAPPKEELKTPPPKVEKKIQQLKEDKKTAPPKGEEKIPQLKEEKKTAPPKGEEKIPPPKEVKIPPPKEEQKILPSKEEKVTCPPKETNDTLEESEESEIVFDRKVYEDYDAIIHEGKGSKKKNLKSYNVEVLNKGFEARVFAEHLNEEVTRTMRSTSFVMLLDLPPKTVSSPKKNKKTNDEIDDELMDYVIVGSVREESPESKQLGKGGKKRKTRLSEDGKPAEKKTKTYENINLLMKNLDVDVFLDKVHG